MAKMMFEMAVGYECSGPECGLMCQEGTNFFECEVNLFQPLEKMFARVEELYDGCEHDDYYLGCRVVRLVPVAEADELKKMQEEMDKEVAEWSGYYEPEWCEETGWYE